MKSKSKSYRSYIHNRKTDSQTSLPSVLIYWLKMTCMPTKWNKKVRATMSHFDCMLNLKRLMNTQTNSHMSVGQRSSNLLFYSSNQGCQREFHCTN